MREGGECVQVAVLRDMAEQCPSARGKECGGQPKCSIRTERWQRIREVGIWSALQAWPLASSPSFQCSVRENVRTNTHTACRTTLCHPPMHRRRKGEECCQTTCGEHPTVPDPPGSDTAGAAGGTSLRHGGPLPPAATPAAQGCTALPGAGARPAGAPPPATNSGGGGTRRCVCCSASWGGQQKKRHRGSQNPKPDTSNLWGWLWRRTRRGRGGAPQPQCPPAQEQARPGPCAGASARLPRAPRRRRSCRSGRSPRGAGSRR